MELNDIQGLLIRGHGELPSAAYVILQIQDIENARSWLAGKIDQVTHGNTKPSSRIQMAFTHVGLEKLGASTFVTHGFSVSFQQGMATEYRARILGDEGDSRQENWRWGGNSTPGVDLALMLFEADREQLAQRLETLKAEYLKAGFQEITVLHSQLNSGQREHFGFRDGIGQPLLAGLSKSGMAENTVPLGEFVLGYQNAYHQLPETPVVDPVYDPNNLLLPSPKIHDLPPSKDFGKNGSYLVFRQLVQDVPGFWKQIKSAAQHENPDAGPEACIQLASKMFGRWPNGTPLALSPDRPIQDIEKPNEFLYAEKDADGFGCPFGAHIRRSNPRDAMPDNKPDQSITITNRHRILRRGRNFGVPLHPSYDPSNLMQAEEDGQERGLHFLCFNANIARQFEFVQHTWNNNIKFAGLYNDPDPVLGIHNPPPKDDPNTFTNPVKMPNNTQPQGFDFTIQADPMRRKINGLSRKVHMVGGAYFFMPGIRALRFLTQYQPENNAAHV